MGIKVTFSCDHVDGRPDLYNGGRCGWQDDSFAYASAGDVELSAAMTKLSAKGWHTAGPQLLCPEHSPTRDPNPITEIIVRPPAKDAGPG